MNNEHKDHKISLPDFDFERTSYISETDVKKDLPSVNIIYRGIRFAFRNAKAFDYGGKTDLATSRDNRVG